MAESLAETLLERRGVMWEKSGSAIDGFFRMLVNTTYGDLPTKDQHQECWTVAKLMLWVFLRELPKVRVGVESAYTSADPHICIGTYLWHTLQAHRVMDEFRAANYHRHPTILPSIVNHLIKYRAPKVKMAALWAKLASQEKDLRELSSSVDKLTTKVNKK